MTAAEIAEREAVAFPDKRVEAMLGSVDYVRRLHEEFGCTRALGCPPVAPSVLDLPIAPLEDGSVVVVGIDLASELAKRGAGL